MAAQFSSPQQRRENLPSRRLQFGDYVVDFDCCELRKRGVRINLQRKPFHVLELLLRRPGELVTRKELVNFLWPDSHVGFEHALNTAVNSLRLALGESSRESRFIETRPGLGYRFIAAVEEINEGDAKSARAATAETNSGAHAECIKGRYLLDRMCEQQAYKSLGFFTAAATDKSCSSMAYAGIADVHCQLAQLGSAPASKLEQRARCAIQTALTNGSDLAQVQVSAGRVRMIFDWDWKGAEEAIANALVLDPDSADALLLRASLLYALGEYDEAKEICHAVVMRDPLSRTANLQLTACLYATRKFEDATEQCWNVLTLSPSFAPAQMLLALSYQELGMHEEALVEFRNAQHCVSFEAAAIAGMGHVLALMGLHNEAHEFFLKLSKQAETRYVSPYWYAVICDGHREEEQAVRHLEEALRQRDPALLSFKADARFDTIREGRNFKVVLPI